MIGRGIGFKKLADMTSNVVKRDTTLISYPTGTCSSDVGNAIQACTPVHTSTISQ